MEEKKHPRVFMDISIHNKRVGKLIFELFDEIFPYAAENFRALCTGEKGISSKLKVPLHYKGTSFYHIVKGGSFVKGGTLWDSFAELGDSIYGSQFPNEPAMFKHDRKGLLSISIADRYAIGSHFAITLKPDDYLDRFYVVFGQLVDGFDTLRKIEELPSLPIEADDYASLVAVKVDDCGVYIEGSDSKADDNPDDESLEDVAGGKRKRVDRSQKNAEICAPLARLTVSPLPKEKNPMVFMDVSIDDRRCERMIFKLFYDVAPFTAENFRALCTGEKGLSPSGQILFYIGSFFYPIEQGCSYVKGGDIYAGGDYQEFTYTSRCPEGFGESIYGSNFPDESPTLEHSKAGLLSMSKDDCKKFGSLFVITLKADPSLDSSYVVFGELIGGQRTLDMIGEYGFELPVQIIQCGAYTEVGR
ncbi:peptidyl-prolyl cis-trans isomerase CYP95-like isoform X2 [Prosopis cineraria]|uniref:peptidyl-prolyl cis-trans isomerase CYP95-like isoform X2 n=1 Tax=Prosopis cineraria TaxID=364024 RepID=UPI00240EC4B1|nr:peptidyl-prolyl cis-trans isomerase CYP95-like isoform X2 [Prosopis cineraria]